MKKIFLLLIALSLLLCAACGTTPTDSGNPQSDPVSNPSSQPSGDVGSTVSRKTEQGDNGVYQYGPQEEEPDMEMTADNSVYLKANGAAGDGAADDAPALRSALDKLSAGGYVLIEKGQYRLASDVTVPSDVTLVFMTGAQLQPAAGVKLTVTGFVKADVRQIFGGKGKVAGLIRNAGYPQW
ncbi:MAG: hypothetical protein IKI50_03880, partial [Clostridia bacterium]|nr:hypothetical protein [Clostridia bacterium]